MLRRARQAKPAAQREELHSRPKSRCVHAAQRVHDDQCSASVNDTAVKRAPLRERTALLDAR
jgi:hypothetical protein